MVNVSQQAGAFFQTDADIAKQKEKEAKYNYTEGDALQLTSKALDIRIFGNHIYIAESGFQVRKISLTVKNPSPHLYTHTKLLYRVGNLLSFSKDIKVL